MNKINKMPEGWMDWNLLTLDQMVDYLKNKYMISSSGEAKCIFSLIEFYERVNNPMGWSENKFFVGLCIGMILTLLIYGLI